jgi:hypothetical protein
MPVWGTILYTENQIVGQSLIITFIQSNCQKEEGKACWKAQLKPNQTSYKEVCNALMFINLRANKEVKAPNKKYRNR